MPQQRTRTWQEKLQRSGYLLGAILFHLILFLMVATWVIWKAPPPPPTDVFHGVAIKIAPPPPQPPSSGAAANNPQFEPQPVVVPVVTPPSMITTANGAFTLDAAKVMNQALTHLTDQVAQGSGLTSGAGGNAGTGNGFGSSAGSNSLLSGYLYDLKQTADRQPTGMDLPKYYEILGRYISQNWDDSILDSYYKSKNPLFTGTYAISTRPSEEAPKAFGLEKEVQPGLWVIHYHTKVMAPKSGEYRFSGFGDNVLVVKINGALVLDAGLNPLTDKAILHTDIPFPWSNILTGERGLLKTGATFHMDLADPVDMDVLIGDDGGACGFYLFIEEIGATYETLPGGMQKLPFFLLNSTSVPTFTDSEEHPPFSPKAEPWQASP